MKKDMLVGITMLLKFTTTKMLEMLPKMLSTETEDIPYAPLTPFINLCLLMDLSVVLSTPLMLNPELITVVSNLSIYLKLDLEIDL